ncbi:hypothetical protein DPEC_G00364280 [Dallia pectoralis]|nr:hypothetical protein DPEC_G00364280 [Dallia pectoralis]
MQVACLAPPESDTPQPPEPRSRRDHKSENRIVETIREELVTLDKLIRVESQGQEYAFVQYRPTEKHKKCAGLKIDPVRQINVFVPVLQDSSIPIETAIHTLMPSGKNYFLARVSLPGLKELSLEPLWMINGRVQLNSKQKWVTVTIQDPALEPCFLDPQSQHLFSQPKRTGVRNSSIWPRKV